MIVEMAVTSSSLFSRGKMHVCFAVRITARFSIREYAVGERLIIGFHLDYTLVHRRQISRISRALEEQIAIFISDPFICCVFTRRHWRDPSS